MAETIYSSYPNDPNQVRAKEYAHAEGERGAIHYEQKQADGGFKPVKGDEFIEYMRPGALQERQEHLAEHADEAKEWLRLERAGKLINEDGRRIDEEGDLLYPNRKEKIAKKAADLASKGANGAKKGAEGVKKISAETRDAIIKAFQANEIERIQQILDEQGIKLEDVLADPREGKTQVKPDPTEAETKVNKPETDPAKRTGPCKIKTRSGEEVKGVVKGPSKKYPGGTNPRNNNLYYEVEVVLKNGNKTTWDNVNAQNVEFVDEAAAAEPAEQAANGKKNSTEQAGKGKQGFAEQHPDDVLRMQEEFEKRLKKVLNEQTILDMNDPGLKDKAQDQIRNKIADEYIDKLPDDQKENADNLKKEILAAMKMDPELLEALRTKEVVYLQGEDEVGKYILRITGGKVERNRNVNNDWEVVGNSDETGWFEVGKGEILKGRVNGTPKVVQEGSSPEDNKGVDTEKMEASIKKIEELDAAITAELEAENPDMEKIKNLQAERIAEMKKMHGVWNEGESSDEVSEISEEEAKALVDERRKKGWKQRLNILKYPNLWPAAIAGYFQKKSKEDSDAAVAQEGDGSGGEGATVTETKETKERRRNRKAAAALMLAGGAVGSVVTAYFLTRGGHSPDVIHHFKDCIPVPNPPRPPVEVDWSSFHPDQFGGLDAHGNAMNAHESVRSMFQVFKHNGYHVNGLTDERVGRILNDMRAHHMHVAFGIDATGHQHIVDAAHGYAGGEPANHLASNLQGLEQVHGSSVRNWHKFAELAAKHGVTIHKG